MLDSVVCLQLADNMSSRQFDGEMVLWRIAWRCNWQLGGKVCDQEWSFFCESILIVLRYRAIGSDYVAIGLVQFLLDLRRFLVVLVGGVFGGTGARAWKRLLPCCIGVLAI